MNHNTITILARQHTDHVAGMAHVAEAADKGLQGGRSPHDPLGSDRDAKIAELWASAQSSFAALKAEMEG